MKRGHQIDYYTFKRILIYFIGEFCFICNEKTKVDIHHLDNDSKNNSLSNMSFICQNCHSLIHKTKTNKEIDLIDYSLLNMISYNEINFLLNIFKWLKK